MNDKEFCGRTYLDLQRQTGTWKNNCWNIIQMRCCVLSLSKWDSGEHIEESPDSDLHWLLLCVLLVRHGAEAVARWVTVPTLRSGEWGECPPAGVRLLAPVSFITATSAHPPAAPSLTWPGQGSSSPWFIYTQGEIWWHTLPFLLIVSTSISTMYVWVWDSNHCTGLKPESHWGKRENGEKLVNVWNRYFIYHVPVLLWTLG